MTDKTLEERFHEYRANLTASEFNDVEVLTNKAQQLSETDPELKARIFVRVQNLQKAKAKANNANESMPISKPSSITEENKKDHLQNYYSKLIDNSVIIRFKSLPPFTIFVIIPTLIFCFYQVFWATERYESQAKVIVQQPDSMSTMDPGMALLSGLGVPSGGSDAELVKAYIYSADMIKYLNTELGLRAHYSQSSVDYFSRIHESSSREELFQYYQDHIGVIIDERSGVISISSQGFDSKYAQALSETIVKRAEWFINSIGHQLANAQLHFIQGEHTLIEQRLAKAQKDLLLFQQQYNLLDPTAEGMAKQQITYTLEGQIAVKQTEMKTLKAVMSNNSPQVKNVENELIALQAQLANERKKLSKSEQGDISISEVMSIFTDYKIKMELSLQAYTSSQISLEKSRIEAYRQMKYLIVVEQATLSEDNKYPNVIYNISLFILLLSMSYGIGKIVVSTINELK